MAPMGRPKSASLDVNVLYDLAAGEKFAAAFLNELHFHGWICRVSPTAIQEMLFHLKRRTPPQFALAEKALRSLQAWKIGPFDLVPVGHGITEQFVRKLTLKGYLPEDEENDGYILAETALVNIPVLITSDSHLLDIPRRNLSAELKAADLRDVQVFRPRDFLEAIC